MSIDTHLNHHSAASRLNPSSSGNKRQKTGVLKSSHSELTVEKIELTDPESVGDYFSWLRKINRNIKQYTLIAEDYNFSVQYTEYVKQYRFNQG